MFTFQDELDNNIHITYRVYIQVFLTNYFWRKNSNQLKRAKIQISKKFEFSRQNRVLGTPCCMQQTWSREPRVSSFRKIACSAKEKSCFQYCSKGKTVFCCLSPLGTKRPWYTTACQAPPAFIDRILTRVVVLKLGTRLLD